jgi:hypothetical protein
MTQEKNIDNLNSVPKTKNMKLIDWVKFYLETLYKVLNDISDYSVKGSKKKQVKVNKFFKNN